MAALKQKLLAAEATQRQSPGTVTVRAARRRRAAADGRAGDVLMPAVTATVQVSARASALPPEARLARRRLARQLGVRPSRLDGHARLHLDLAARALAALERAEDARAVATLVGAIGLCLTELEAAGDATFPPEQNPPG